MRGRGGRGRRGGRGGRGGREGNRVGRRSHIREREFGVRWHGEALSEGGAREGGTGEGDTIRVRVPGS